MLIDWFTVIAQVVNFLILVYLLKRFLYKPILNAIDKREKRVASQLQEAADQKATAEEQHQKYEQLNEELHKNKETLMAAAHNEAEAEQQRLMEDARKEYDGLRSRLHDSLEKEQKNMEVDLKNKVQQETFAIARKTLADLSDVSLESQIIQVFIKKIKAMGESEKAQLMAAMQPSASPVVVQSTFEINDEQKENLAKAIKTILGKNTQLNFKKNDNTLGGIELSANGFKIAWNISDHLNSLEKKITGISENLKTTPENISHEK